MMGVEWWLNGVSNGNRMGVEWGCMRSDGGKRGAGMCNAGEYGGEGRTRVGSYNSTRVVGGGAMVVIE